MGLFGLKLGMVFDETTGEYMYERIYHLSSK